ncbi:putative immunoglobulin I-set domain protein [Trichinella spiralis]|uniref:putative immunoglobulin I-set domain protein n=1 Tax=Trichinella spiralis TaxID=6334 RepID=UPI0001EFCD57|nr:putative immunoglobulin I-set domain protein [Trichinella spiralis]
MEIVHQDATAMKTPHFDLSFNRIQSINKMDLMNFNDLISLDMAHNLLKFIESYSFTSLANLKILNLSYNELQFLNNDTFVGLSQLRHLSLNDNALLLIEEAALEPLINLIELDVSNNEHLNFSSLLTAIEKLNNLKLLQTDEHHIRCNCSTVVAIVSLLQNNTELGIQTEDCFYKYSEADNSRCLEELINYANYCKGETGDVENIFPECSRRKINKTKQHQQHKVHLGSKQADLANARVRRIPRRHRRRSPVKIVRPPENVDADLDETVSFTCLVSGYPNPRIHWFCNGNKLISSNRIKFYQHDQKVVITNVQREDNGVYTCVAENAISQSTATAFLQVKSRPEFRLRPQNTIALEGAEVKLECDPVGYPQPAIVWTKNGRSIPTNRRIVISNAGTVLKINSISADDEGQYTCYATNALGSIEWSVAVKVKQSFPPRMQNAPSTLILTAGNTASFPCRVVANPEPTITWLFNGNPIRTVKGHYEMSSQGTLYVFNVTKSDEGFYTCQASNAVGAISADAQLEVIASNLSTDQKAPAILNVDSEFIRSTVQQATANVDKAINWTRQKLYDDHPKSPAELMALLRYPGPAALEHARAREIYEQTIRSYDGSCNNFEHPLRGASLTSFKRLLPPIYENGFDQPVGWRKGKLYYGYPKPNVRTVSQMLISTKQVTNDTEYSHMLMQWGQFLDHDLTLTVNAPSILQFQTGVDCKRTCQNRPPCFNIEIPPNDRRIKYGVCMEFERSSAVCGSGDTSVLFDTLQHREQLNVLTAYIDASNVYGSEEADALNLRDLFSDHGQLKFDITSHKQKPYLPFNRNLPMDCRRNSTVPHSMRCLMAGDYRANEQVGLLAMHTLWMREHNRIAAKLLRINSHWDGEKIYQEARKIIGAQMQHITYHSWLPKILGPQGMNMLGTYGGYNQAVDSTISNAFATAAFRFGHTLIQPILIRLDENFRPHSAGHLPLEEAFFAPERLLNEGGIDPILRGMFSTPAKLPTTGQYLNNILTEQLFNKAHDVALDLAALNIQRGRDHALPGYLEYRKFCNLSSPDTFDGLSDVIPDQSIRRKLQILYGHPGNVDLWVGGVLEKLLPGARVGQTFACIIADQFRRIRDGDRFWYENAGVFRPDQLYEIKKTTLARILCDSGDEIDRVQRDIFKNIGSTNPEHYTRCEHLPNINLNMWQECCEEDCRAAIKFETVDDALDKDTTFLKSSNIDELLAIRRKRSITASPIMYNYFNCSCKNKIPKISTEAEHKLQSEINSLKEAVKHLEQIIMKLNLNNK